MAIDFATGGSTYFTKPPRVVMSYDSVSGCPPTRAAGTAMASTSLTLTVAASLVIEGKLIRTNATAARCDLSLYVSTGQVCRTLDHNDGLGSDWQQHSLLWMGTLAAGTHTIYMYSDNCANAWGCGGYWGHIQILIFE